jgi:hypothetical protein
MKPITGKKASVEATQLRGNKFTQKQMIIPPDCTIVRVFEELPYRSEIYVDRGTLCVYNGNEVVEKIHGGKRFKVNVDIEYKFGTTDRGTSCIELYRT